MKKERINYIALWLILFLSSFVYGQNKVNIGSKILSYEAYIGYVKTHHPLVKQANLILSSGEANVLKSRGGFDPKIEVDYNTKDFKKKDYYDLFNATFKVPTWYGVEFKANYEENSGQFLNSQNNVPVEGLYSAGVSVSAIEGLLINDRMATLKKAKLFLKQSEADRNLAVNDLLFEATLAYFDWIKANNEQQIYSNFLKNATIRFKATKRRVEVGDKAPIDSVESKITIQNRALGQEAAFLKRVKSTYKVSNFLWSNDIPLELQLDVLPQIPTTAILESSLEIENLEAEGFMIENHPKMQSLNYKIDGLNVDRRLKLNKLLPKLNFNYNFISSTPEETNTFNRNEYKAGFSFSTPLFLRKERGDLRLTKFKLQDANFELLSTELKIKNKVEVAYAEINSLEKQYQMINEILENYVTMVNAEERKFFLGESSLFLINSRERKLIDAQLKQSELQIKLLNTRAKLFNTLGMNPLVN